MNKIDEELILAVRTGDIKEVKALLDNGADIHAREDDALRWAAQNGHKRTVELLLDNGADLHARGDDALIWAAQHGHTATVELLLDRGANVNAGDDKALIWAASNGHKETVELLNKWMTADLRERHRNKKEDALCEETRLDDLVDYHLEKGHVIECIKHFNEHSKKLFKSTYLDLKEANDLMYSGEDDDEDNIFEDIFNNIECIESSINAIVGTVTSLIPRLKLLEK